MFYHRMSFLGKKWVIKNQTDANLIDKMLENRGLKTQEDVYGFFNYSLNRLHDPFLLKDMQKAVDRLKEAIKKEEKIMIFGDYDVDGTSATALLHDFFQKIGANIHYRLPGRDKDGYGLKDYFIRDFKKEAVDVLITVDCGTTSVKEIDLANQLGITVIITDHHDAPATLPTPYALINPKQPACDYPNKELSGSAVAYKLVCALAPYFFDAETTQTYLYQQMGIAVLGLVADCMALTGENRVLTNNGLKSLNEGHHAGIRALLEEAGASKQLITSQTIGFVIGPRINAAGRLDSAEHALQLLLGNTEKVPVLSELNQKRRHIVDDFVKQASQKILNMPDIPHIIVLSDPQWSAGTLGLIAGKMVEKFSRPVIAMQEKEDEYVASCRSLNDFDITAFLRNEAESLFTNMGGHMLAGGFSLPKKNIEKLQVIIEKKAPQYINLDNFHGQLEVECIVNPHELNFKMHERLSKFEPFGMGNPQPTLVLKNANVTDVQLLGKEGKHLRLPLQAGQKDFQAIAFRFGEHVDKIHPEKSYDIAFNLDINEWRGRRNLQLKVVDIREANS